MPNFAYERTGSYGSLTTYFPKIDETTANDTAHASANEWNGVVDAALSVSYWLTSGSFFGFVRSAVAPTASVGVASDFIWMNNSGVPMLHRRDGTDSALSGNVTISGSLAQFYQLVQNTGSNVAQAVTMSFDGTTMSASDNGSSTVVSVGPVVGRTQTAQTFTNKTYQNTTLTGTVSGDFHFSSSVRVRKNDIGVSFAGAYGAKLENQLAATSGSNPLSPAVVFATTAFHSTASVSQNISAVMQMQPVQRAADPSTNLMFLSSVNNSTLVEKLKLGASAITSSVPITTTIDSGTLVRPNWSSASFQNSYSNFAPPSALGNYPFTTYWKDSFGIVYLRVCANSGTNGAVIFTLPQGYRPSYGILVPGYIDNPPASIATAYVLIKVNGDVLCLSANGNSAVLAWAEFPGEL